MSKLSKESDALHTKCMAEAAGSADPNAFQFTQADLEKHSTCSPGELLLLINELVSHLLFRPYRSSTGSVWRIRSRELASSLGQLSEQERIVFGHVEESGTNGIWVKKVKAITQMAPAEVQKGVGKLEKLGLIKGFKSIKTPAQRMYMLSHLAPSDEVTGGSFFDAGELDESMVEELQNLIIFHVRAKSWYDSKRKARGSFVVEDEDRGSRKRKAVTESIERDHHPTNGKKQKQAVAISDDDSDEADTYGAHDGHANGKRKAITPDIEDLAPPTKSRRRRGSDAVTYQLAYPVGTCEYPTTESILDFLRNCNAIRDSKADALTVDEVQGLIDVLVWDSKLERVRNGYRTVRGVQFMPTGAEYDTLDDISRNALAEVPCGRCQLFDLCQEGTKVSASSCVYYQEWIKT